MSTRPPALRWGVVGASDIAETRMIPALNRCGQTVQGVYSSSRTHAEEYAGRNGIESVYDDLELMLERPDIDAVYISSANGRHLRQAEAAALADKHVLCEKPMTTSLTEARAMVEACAKESVVLAVNHHLPAAGTHRRIRELVHAGAIGRPLAVNVRHATLLPERLRGWRLGGEPGAGAVMDLSCHDASVVNPLLARQALETASFTCRQGGWEAQSEDASIAIVLYDDEVLVHFHDSFTSPFTRTYLEIHGDEGSIHASDVMTPEPLGEVVLTDAHGDREVDVEDRRHTYDITLQAFCEAVAGTGRPIVTGEDAFDAIAVSIAILESARTSARVGIEKF